MRKETEGYSIDDTEEVDSISPEIYGKREIIISFLDKGTIVRIGCKTIAFSSREEMREEVNEYLLHPKRSVEKWNKIFNKQIK